MRSREPPAKESIAVCAYQQRGASDLKAPCGHVALWVPGCSTWVSCVGLWVNGTWRWHLGCFGLRKGAWRSSLRRDLLRYDYCEFVTFPLLTYL
jgi:hypothetical protein